MRVPFLGAHHRYPNFGELNFAEGTSPLWVGGRDGYRYSVIHDGKLLVERSRDPECDAARALLAKGITGKLTLLDGKTGRPRTIIDIERAATLRTVDENERPPRFKKYVEGGSGEDTSAVIALDGEAA